MSGCILTINLSIDSGQVKKYNKKAMKIFVKAKPLAKKDKIEKVSDNNFVVWVKESPE